MVKKFTSILGYSLVIFSLTLVMYVFCIRAFYRDVSKNLTSSLIDTMTNKIVDRNMVDTTSTDNEDGLDINIVNQEEYSSALNEDMETLKIDDNTFEKGIAILNIPSCKVKSVITEGVSNEQLKYSVGHFPDTPKPKDGGNFCVAGHSSVIYDQVLNNLHKINYGDEIEVITSSDNFKYYVTDIQVIEPSATYVLSNTTDSQITIITCTEGGKRRLCVVGKQYLTKDEQENNKSMSVERESEINSFGSKSLIINTVGSILKDYSSILPLSPTQERSLEIVKNDVGSHITLWTNDDKNKLKVNTDSMLYSKVHLVKPCKADYKNMTELRYIYKPKGESNEANNDCR